MSVKGVEIAASFEFLYRVILNKIFVLILIFDRSVYDK